MDNLTDDADGEARPASVEDPSDQVSWGVRAPATMLCLAGTLGAVAWLLLAGSSEDRVVAAVTALVLGAVTLSGFRMRRRLVANRGGLLLNGPLGSRRIGWNQVTSIDVPVRRRRGLTSTTLEIELDDDGLIVLGRFDLGVDPAEVGRTLRALAAHRE